MEMPTLKDCATAAEVDDVRRMLLLDPRSTGRPITISRVSLQRLLNAATRGILIELEARDGGR